MCKTRKAKLKTKELTRCASNSAGSSAFSKCLLNCLPIFPFVRTDRTWQHRPTSGRTSGFNRSVASSEWRHWWWGASCHDVIIRDLFISLVFEAFCSFELDPILVRLPSTIIVSSFKQIIAPPLLFVDRVFCFKRLKWRSLENRTLAKFLQFHAAESLFLFHFFFGSAIRRRL